VERREIISDMADKMGQMGQNLNAPRLLPAELGSIFHNEQFGGRCWPHRLTVAPSRRLFDDETLRATQLGH